MNIKVSNEELNYTRISKTFVIDIADKEVTVTKYVHDDNEMGYMTESDWDIVEGGDTLTDEEQDALDDFVNELNLWEKHQ